MASRIPIPQVPLLLIRLQSIWTHPVLKTTSSKTACKLGERLNVVSDYGFLIYGHEVEDTIKIIAIKGKSPKWPIGLLASTHVVM